MCSRPTKRARRQGATLSEDFSQASQRLQKHMRAISLGECAEPLTFKKIKRLVRLALRLNDVEALSLLLSLELPHETQSGVMIQLEVHPWLERRSRSLLELTVATSDAAECAMELLNCLEQQREPRIRGGGDDPEYICERAAELLRFARQQYSAETPRRRVAKACLLHAMRLCELSPHSSNQRELLGLEWWPLATDLPKDLATLGGYDLSEGAEPKPVMWINEVDDDVPEPFLYLRRCANVDMTPDWKRRPCRPCKPNKDPLRGLPLLRGGLPAESACSCLHAQFCGEYQRLSNAGMHVECNWTCDCPSTCMRRNLQYGGGFKLQVFKHRDKGWCLRTLEPIPKGRFVMEYVGERVSQDCLSTRASTDPATNVYVMDTCDKSELSIAYQEHHALDALFVRNVAAFASFACSPLTSNLEKRPMLWQHWDMHIKHVGFFATRDIQPSEELAYLRLGSPPPKSSIHICKCGHPQCAGKV